MNERKISEEITSTSDFADESDSFLSYDTIKESTPRRWPWILSTVTLGFFSLALLVAMLIGKDRSCASSPPWKKSDFPAARDAIEYIEVKFIGNSAYDENGNFYIPNAVPVDYIGAGPLVDEAWRNLTGERDFLISDEEAFELWGNQRMTHWHHRKQGYEVGLDVFHTLHCLDRLRQLYYPDVYPVSGEMKENSLKHRGHCINQIRQYIMCAGDMSAYGSKWYDNPGRNYADSDVVHTCRNFDKLREWTRNRYHAGGSLAQPRVEAWDEWHAELQHYQ